MNEEELRKHRCCFTGHRPEKLHLPKNKIRELLRVAIKQAIHDGFTTFISGMARGIDMWAAELVLEEKNKNSKIKLICAIPLMGFERSWNEQEKQTYRSIIAKADYVKYVSDHYFRACFQVRNEWMVNHSHRVIATYNGESGGTRNTINYAKRMGVDIINILENNR